MKLYYYQRSDQWSNFGDQLNQWLWPRLLPDFFNEDPEITFVGFGTLLNHLLPIRTAGAREVIIFSTGVGYERGLTQIPSHFKIYCVRGNYSTQKLGLDASQAITDGAVLVREVWKYGKNSRDRVSFMPHIHHERLAGKALERICNDLGIQYINPATKDLEIILKQIDSSRLLLAEAMHGAIVADAFRVPWIPICTSPRILAFKWRDWCSSIQLPYAPQYLPPLLPNYPPTARGVRSSIHALPFWVRLTGQRSQQGLESLLTQGNEALFKESLMISSTLRPWLSLDSERTD
jgi:succinoglycan biosynthesis protein ExoV